MMNRIKKITALTFVVAFSVFVFYRGKLSLQVDKRYAGEHHIVVTQEGIYTGRVNSNGLIKFPWNPLRKSGIFTIALSGGVEAYQRSLVLSPSYGRYYLYPDSEFWSSGRILYVFGVPINETKTTSVNLKKKQNEK